MVSRRAVICAGVCGLTGACLASILWGMDEALALTSVHPAEKPSYEERCESEEQGCLADDEAQ